MNRYALAGILMVSVIGSGCASYAPRDQKQGGSGFSEKRISDGKYWLRFYGGVYDGHDKLLVFWRQRASELCGKDNYTGEPQKKADNGSAMVYSAGVVYPSAYSVPYVEGRLECTDKAVARRIGPEKYNPDERMKRLALGEIKVTAQGTKSWFPESLASFLKNELDSYEVSTKKDDSEYSLDIEVIKYIADGGGDSLLGSLSAGTYSATSIAMVTERQTGRVLGKREITNSVEYGSEKEYILKESHSRAIVEFAASIFHNP